MTNVEGIPIGRPAQGRVSNGTGASDFVILSYLGISDFVILSYLGISDFGILVLGYFGFRHSLVFRH